MSNHPDDFKGTNMDVRDDYTAAQIDCQLRHMDRLPILIGDFIKDYDQKYGLNTSEQDLKHAIESISDVIGDMFYEERQRLGEPDCPNPNFKTASDIIMESAYDIAKFNARTPMLKLPKGETI